MDEGTPGTGRDFESPGDNDTVVVRILPDTAPPRGRVLNAYVPQAEEPAPKTAQLPMPEQAVPRNEPVQVAPGRSGPSTCAVLGVTFGLLALACMVLAYAAFRDGVSGLGRLGGLVPGINFQLQRTPTVVVDTNQPTVVDRVRALSKLESIHYQVEKVISGTSDTGSVLPPPLAGDRILLVAHGEVVAGVDLSKLKQEDVVQTEDAVTMTLPAPEILYSKLDNDRTHVYDRETGFFSKPDPNLESQVRATAEREIMRAAQEDGILDQAKVNAQATLRTLLYGLGFKRVEFKEGP